MINLLSRQALKMRKSLKCCNLWARSCMKKYSSLDRIVCDLNAVQVFLRDSVSKSIEWYELNWSMSSLLKATLNLNTPTTHFYWRRLMMSCRIWDFSWSDLVPLSVNLCFLILSRRSCRSFIASKLASRATNLRLRRRVWSTSWADWIVDSLVTSYLSRSCRTRLAVGTDSLRNSSIF